MEEVTTAGVICGVLKMAPAIAASVQRMEPDMVRDPDPEVIKEAEGNSNNLFQFKDGRNLSSFFNGKI